MKKKVLQKDSGRRKRKQKIAVMACFFAVAFAVVSYRCISLHMADNPRLARRAETQYLSRIEEPPPRGNILDADDEELAVSVPNFAVAVRPQKIRDREAFLGSVAPLLGMTMADVARKLDVEKKYVWLKRYVDREDKEKIARVDPAAIEMVKTSKRFYPNREIASQILGAVGPDNNGLGGLELFYDRYLRGGGERSSAFRDARGKTFETEETLGSAAGGQEPHHLALTIRKNIQYVTEKELSEACDTYHARACTAIVVEPSTGALLSMASYPTFNPNAYQDYDLSSWRNLAITDTFEPGSTFKTIMAAAALESGLVNPQEKFFCENGKLQVGNHIIHDHGSYGLMTLRDILKVSSNIGIYKVGRKVGKKTFGEIVSLFGFGRPTGVDYPGESSGFMRAPSTWQDIEFANISFGQGLRVTPLQLAMSFATLANGGVRMKPYFVRRVTDNHGKSLLEIKPRAVARAVSEKTAAQVLDMMTEVPREGGTATKAALPGYTVAGKTGTAQKFVGGTYSHTKFMSSFVGIVPAEKPRFVILVSIDEPQGVVYGGLVAAPVFRKIAWEALRDLGVAPTVPFEKPVLDYAEASETPPVPLDMKELPDFRGMSKRRVLALLDQAGLEAHVEGSGVAVSQDPLPGHPVEKGQTCKVVFRAEE